MARELNVTAADAGERLDTFLAGPLGSRARAQRLIDDGLVLVDGAPRPKRHRLRGGERVAVEEAEPPPQDDRSDAPYEVRYEDGDLLVVDKPAGVVVHPARGHRTGTLAQALAGRAAGGPEPWRAGIVHRLDRDTSGLLVVAKSEEAHRRLRALMKARGIEREYLALVEGRPPARTGTIDAPLGRDRRERKRISVDSDVPARRSRISPSSGRCPDRRSCACAWRRGERTRSALTFRRSATRSPAIPSTAAPASTGWSASSCTPPVWPSTIR